MLFIFRVIHLDRHSVLQRLPDLLREVRQVRLPELRWEQNRNPEFRHTAEAVMHLRDGIDNLRCFGVCDDYDTITGNHTLVDRRKFQGRIERTLQSTVWWRCSGCAYSRIGNDSLYRNLPAGQSNFHVMSESLSELKAARAAFERGRSMEPPAPAPAASMVDARQAVLAALRGDAREAKAAIARCQEEPKNQGAWTFMEPNIEWVLRRINARMTRARYAGRPAAASPATGLASEHKAQQAALVDDALTYDS